MYLKVLFFSHSRVSGRVLCHAGRHLHGALLRHLPAPQVTAVADAVPLLQGIGVSFCICLANQKGKSKIYKFSYFLDDLSKLNSKRNILIMNFKFKQLYLEIFFVE